MDALYTLLCNCVKFIIVYLYIFLPFLECSGALAHGAERRKKVEFIHLRPLGLSAPATMSTRMYVYLGPSCPTFVLAQVEVGQLLGAAMTEMP